jgi:seryl-tRNA(Sec) selenium transferase
LNEIECRLRSWQPPIIGRLQDNAIHFDVRCLSDADTEELLAACQSLASE